MSIVDDWGWGIEDGGFLVGDENVLRLDSGDGRPALLWAGRLLNRVYR